MSKQLAFAAAFGLVVAVFCHADDKWQPPAAPSGWKYATGKDGRYMFLFPNDAQRTGTRDQTYTGGGVRAKGLVNYCVLRDNTLLEVQSLTVTGPGTNGLTVNDAYEIIVDAEKSEGYSVGEAKEVTLGAAKGREYRLKDKIYRRMVISIVKPRIYILNVGSSDEAKLESEPVNTFLKSLVFIPKEVQEAAAKERATKAEEAGKEAMEKYGFKWTLKLDEMTPPDAPVAGKVCGVDFKPDAVSISAGGQVRFRQGAGGIPEGDVIIYLDLKPNDALESREFEVKPGPPGRGKSYSIHLSGKEKGSRTPKREIVTSNYAMKLAFGMKEADGTIPGTIYLCTSDAGHSFLAGKFRATAK
jgi:hypothetical protein